MKRFTDTSKWTDPWFRRLSAPAKMLWFYILDHCDNLGIVEIDLELASLDCGIEITADALAEIGARIEKARDGKYIVPKFIGFQIGQPSEGCQAHKKVIQAINDLGLVQDSIGYHYPTASLPNEVQMTINSLKDKDKDKDKEEEEDKTRLPERASKKPSVKISKSRPDNREEFDGYFQEIGLYPRDAEATWNKWEGNGWTNSGKKIVCWKSTVRAWKASGYMPSQKSPMDSERDWPKAAIPLQQQDDEDEDLMAKFKRLREEEIQREVGDHPDFDESTETENEEEFVQCF